MSIEDPGGAFRELARDLTNIETNTILASGITGRKMPVYPHALQDILRTYAHFLAFDVGIDVDRFCRDFETEFGSRLQEAGHAGGNGAGDGDPDSNGRENDAKMGKLEPSFGQGTFTTPLPNGPWSFYMLRWLAAKALSQKRHPLPERHVGVVARIRFSSDQLKIITRELGKLGGGNPYIGVMRDEICRMEADPEEPRPPAAPPEHLTAIRKIWDIGADTIVLQTVLQLDGDVIFRVRRGIDLSKRQALLKAHEDACELAASHWQSMFELIAAMVTGLAGRIFGSSGSRDGSAS